MTHNDRHRHTVLVDFVRTIDDYDFRMLDENTVDILIDKEQASDSLVGGL